MLITHRFVENDHSTKKMLNFQCGVIGSISQKNKGNFVFFVYSTFSELSYGEIFI